MLTQELTLVSHLLKNLVERADKDEDGEVTIEEILTFADFEFIESTIQVVPFLVSPGTSMFYLVRPDFIEMFFSKKSWHWFPGEVGMQKRLWP